LRGASDRDLIAHRLITTTEILARFKKGSGTVAGTAQRVLRTTVPDPFLNQAEVLRSFGFWYDDVIQ
jgi:hypothetical protein